MLSMKWLNPDKSKIIEKQILCNFVIRILLFLLFAFVWLKVEGLVNPITCTQMFRAELFVTAPNWKQSKCPSTDECLNKM